METVKRLIEGENYKKLLIAVKDAAKIDVNETSLPSALLNYDLGRMKAAKTNADNLNAIIESDFENVKKFSLLRLNFSDSDEQEFSNGEDRSEDEKDIVLETLPYYKNFLVTCLVEYYLLKSNPSELLTYLKTTRIPKAKQFEKELREIYSKI